MAEVIDQLSSRTTFVLIADDEVVNRKILTHHITELGYTPIEVSNGQQAIDYIKENQPDLVFLSTMMPVLNGMEVLTLMQNDKETKYIPVIVTSTMDELESVIKCVELGADDYLMMPYNPHLLKARIKASLKKKMYHDVEQNFFRQMDDYSRKLEELVQEQVKEISDGQLATIFAMAKLAESRDPETGRHLLRVSAYCSVIAGKMMLTPKYKKIIDEEFVNTIASAAPLHDIGKVGILDYVLNKPGKLTPEEFEKMKMHTVIGADTLKEVIEKHPSNEFVRIGIDIAENHHEKWDGTGYPHGLVGENIPLAARIMTVGDVYDALTTKRCYKEAFSHDLASKIIIEGSGSMFDPDIVDIFIEFQDVFKEIKETVYA